MASNQRIAALDGVRGIAILSVIVYHASYKWWFSESIVDQAYARVSAAGWVGVDLFFVLSGFLITGILYDSRERAGYFRDFYVRRVLRIFPLYFVFLLLVLPLAAGLLSAAPAADLAALRARSPWYLAYAANGLIALRGWDAAVLDTAHLWSLAVEEQFYLLWPPIVLLLSRRALLRTCAAMAVVALAARGVMVAAGAPAAAVYVLPFTRMDALLTGAAIALLAREVGVAPLARIAPRVLVWAGLVGVAAFAVAPARMSYASPAVLTVGLTAVSLACGAILVLALASRPESRWGQAVRSRSLATFGKYAYALYVFHPAVLAALMRLRWGTVRFSSLAVGGVQLPVHLAFTAFATLVSLGVAWLSWNLLEKHFLRLKDRLSHPHPSPAPVVAPAA